MVAVDIQHKGKLISSLSPPTSPMPLPLYKLEIYIDNNNKETSEIGISMKDCFVIDVLFHGNIIIELCFGVKKIKRACFVMLIINFEYSFLCLRNLKIKKVL
jgi:hypothetical protein